MSNRQKFVIAATLALAIMPLPISARPHGARAEPPAPDDPILVLIEDPTSSSTPDNSPKITAEKSGSLPAKGAPALRVNVDLGDVRVFTDESAHISYRAIVEADSRDPGAEEFLHGIGIVARQTSGGVALDARVPWRTLHGRFNASIEIHIPRRYKLEVTTGGGNIDVQDIDGRVRLTSAGGNIHVGSVRGRDDSTLVGERADGQPNRLKPVLLARLETQGGQISVGDVAGTLRATTSGGHITAGNIDGDAILHTGGGQIYAGRIAGAATLDSGGGNIHVDGAGSSVTADTAGGGIVLRQAEVPLRVSATSGGITAWLRNATESKTSGNGVGGPKPFGASQLTSTDGDIIVYIPHTLSATIDAIVEQGRGHRIAADPSLPMQIRYRDFTGAGDSDRAIVGAARLNGGGEIFHLKSVSGNIVLRQIDPRLQSSGAFPTGWMQGGVTRAILEPLSSGEPDEFADADGFFAEMRRRILESWWGGIPVDADEMQKHIERSVPPVYPDVARQAGVEGDVVLRVTVSPSGRVSDIQVLDGPPILARAAVEAVQQWQYQSPRMNGRPATVVTTLVVSFRLH